MRTNSVRPFRWLMRVGLSHVLKDWRLTFFSSAPRMRVQRSSTVEAVGTKDIHFLHARAAARPRSQHRKTRKRENTSPPHFWGEVGTSLRLAVLPDSYSCSGTVFVPAQRRSHVQSDPKIGLWNA